LSTRNAETLATYVMIQLGWDANELARLIEVDRKTAARWLSGERTPNRKSAWLLVELLRKWERPITYCRLRQLLRATRRLWEAGEPQRQCSIAIAATIRLADGIELPCLVLRAQAELGAESLDRLAERPPKPMIMKLRRRSA
jgi:hypothetical protein